MEDELREKASGRHGAKLLDRLNEGPELKPGLQFYFDAWQELATDRQLGMSVGPIPGMSIRALVKELKLDQVESYEFQYLIRKMDSAYLEYVAEQSKKKTGK